MKIIGITGNIGSGKSTAARICGEMGAATIDLDAVAHQLYNDDDGLKEVLINAFGEDILNTDGQIDRKVLGQIVFNDRQKLDILNLLVHPRITVEVRTRLHIYETMQKDAVVIHGALLLDILGKDFLDELWVTVASEKNTLVRLQIRGIDVEEAKKRRLMQTDEQKLIAQADAVLQNDWPKKEFEDKVQEIYELHVLVSKYGTKDNHKK
ncbi:MAG: dephospho-CoA kinase [Chloroflexi bacterium]|nr:dephospho-CoA kinase [Chloroflexota bacterium]